jgi:hypothetical protein
VQTDGPVQRDAAQESGGLLSCASCNEEVTSGAAARCPECGALYHVPCWNELSGCVTPKCRGYRRVPNRGPLTLVSNAAVEVLPERPDPAPSSVKVPPPQVELLPSAAHLERARERRRPGWVATVAIAVAALALGIAGTLALRHTGDVVHQEKGYRTGWQAGYRAGSAGAFDNGFKKGNQAGWSAGYQRGFVEGCRAAGGADVGCTNTVVPAGTQAPATLVAPAGTTGTIGHTSGADRRAT